MQADCTNLNQGYVDTCDEEDPVRNAGDFLWYYDLPKFAECNFIAPDGSGASNVVTSNVTTLTTNVTDMIGTTWTFNSTGITSNFTGTPGTIPAVAFGGNSTGTIEDATNGGNSTSGLVPAETDDGTPTGVGKNETSGVNPNIFAHKNDTQGLVDDDSGQTPPPKEPTSSPPQLQVLNNGSETPTGNMPASNAFDCNDFAKAVVFTLAGYCVAGHVLGSLFL